MKWCAAFVVLFGTCFAMFPLLTVIPRNQVVEAGRDAVFKCEYFPKYMGHSEGLDWLLPDGISVTNLTTNQSNMSEIYARFSVKDGKLTIKNVSEADSGLYVCANKERSLLRTSSLRIYHMPSYFQEGMIVIVINGVLIVVFLSCCAWTTYATKKAFKKVARQEKNIELRKCSIELC